MQSLTHSSAPTVKYVSSITQFKPSAHLQVAIVGAGAAGLSCALHLHDRGVESAVFERDKVPSGSTALSSGFIPAPCTRLQVSMSIKDSVELFVSDLRRKSKGQGSQTLEVAYAGAVAKALDALELNHGFNWEILDQFLYPGHSVHRMHALAERTGQALMGRLQLTTDKLGIPVLTHSLVNEIWMHDDLVIGVGIQRSDGALEHYGCDALVLCCNGYGGNQELIKRYIPQMQNATFAGHIGNDGSAVIWGTQLGAELCDLGGYQGHGSWAVPHGILVTWALMIHGGIQLNALGERFHDETKGYSEAAVEVLKQPAGVAWCVFDESAYLHGLEFPDFKSADQAGAVLKFSNLAQLAESIGCDVQKIQQSLRSIDQAIVANKGEDKATGRIFKRALCIGDIGDVGDVGDAQDSCVYAVKVTGALFHTQGGLNIDENAKVLKSGVGAFDNLYAAGGAARGVSGNEVWGYLSGNGLLSAFAGGYLAASSIHNAIKDKNSLKA